MTEPPVLLDRRANRLARGLVASGVEHGDRVVVLCCADHGPDLVVARLASERVGATSIVLSTVADRLADRLRAAAPRVVLACAEGVDAWRASGVPAVVIGDAPGVVWWKALELQHPPSPLAASAVV